MLIPYLLLGNRYATMYVSCYIIRAKNMIAVRGGDTSKKSASTTANKTRKPVTFPKTVTRNQAFEKTVTLIVTVTSFLFKTVTFP